MPSGVQGGGGAPIARASRTFLATASIDAITVELICQSAAFAALTICAAAATGVAACATTFNACCTAAPVARASHAISKLAAVAIDAITTEVACWGAELVALALGAGRAAPCAAHVIIAATPFSSDSKAALAAGASCAISKLAAEATAAAAAEATRLNVRSTCIVAIAHICATAAVVVAVAPSSSAEAAASAFITLQALATTAATRSCRVTKKQPAALSNSRAPQLSHARPRRKRGPPCKLCRSACRSRLCKLDKRPQARCRQRGSHSVDVRSLLGKCHLQHWRRFHCSAAGHWRQPQGLQAASSAHLHSGLSGERRVIHAHLQGWAASDNVLVVASKMRVSSEW